MGLQARFASRFMAGNTHAARVAVLLGLLTVLWGGPACANVSTQRAIEARYLQKFAPFVQWPPTAFDSSAAPLAICIAGPDPFGPALENAVRDQHVNGHAIVVRPVDAVRPGMGCHMLFMAGNGGDGTEEALRAITHEPVLTVTDGDGGLSGSIIQFVTVAGRVRFTIDQNAAQTSGIAISSKLLEQAVNVTR